MVLLTSYHVSHYTISFTLYNQSLTSASRTTPEPPTVKLVLDSFTSNQACYPSITLILYDPNATTIDDPIGIDDGNDSQITSQTQTVTGDNETQATLTATYKISKERLTCHEQLCLTNS